MYTKNISNTEEAINFIKGLITDDKFYHLDDDPSDIINGKTGEPLFTKEEAKCMEERVLELHEFLDDPFEVAIEFGALG